MLASCKQKSSVFIVVVFLAISLRAYAQPGGNSTAVNGTVTDPSGSVVVNATVEIHNPVSQFDRTTSTDSAGKFTFANVPFNPYHLTVKAPGFATYMQDVDVRSVVPPNLSVGFQVKVSSEEVTVESTGQDLLENEPTFHTDVDRELFDKLPLESKSSSVSSLVTEATPGIPPIPTASFTAWAIKRRTHFLWTVSRSRISRAKFSPTRFRSIPSSPWK
jgi:Carboxypeptidase regulatory-like domain